ncbi:MAG: DNA-binding protein WhiA [Veillonellaceae bacterium]|nr:DNA-binding protein WhiA [Veillonellaceae bacterium]
MAISRKLDNRRARIEKPKGGLALSFAGDVKNELVRVAEENACCEQAELSALLWMGGVISFGGKGRLGIKFVTENAAVARKALRSLKKEGVEDTEVKVTRALRLKKNNSYELRALPSPAVTNLLARMDILREGLLVEAPASPPRKNCCRKAWLRGAFLAGGSINRPEVEYHLEMVTQNEGFAQTLVAALRSFGLNSGLTSRKQDCVVYMKEGDAITAFLSLVGAHEALLEFENVRIVKSMRNQVNRLVNCETANLAKTVNAAVRQIEGIRRIINQRGIDSLPRSLREVAELRLAYPEATLQELVEAFDGMISRSGMSHRLRALERLAEELAAEKLP